MGYQATLGWWITDAFEVLGRYEWIDPNTENDNNVGNSNYDQLTWITAGMNYRLSEGAEVSLNYIFRLEQGDDIDVDSGKIPTADPKYEAVDNDLLLIQVQVWQ
jgi:hypothetical protein